MFLFPIHFIHDFLVKSLSQRSYKSVSETCRRLVLIRLVQNEDALNDLVRLDV